MGKTAEDIENVVIRTHEACVRIIDKQHKPMTNFADRDHCVQVSFSAYRVQIPSTRDNALTTNLPLITVHGLCDVVLQPFGDNRLPR